MNQKVNNLVDTFNMSIIRINDCALENVEGRTSFRQFQHSLGSDQGIRHYCSISSIFLRCGVITEKAEHLLDENDEVESRQSLFGLPNINSVVNPMDEWMNLLPVIPNPDNFFLSRIGATCRDSYGRSGICILPSLCALYGGMANGFCGIACVCCVSK